MKKIRNIAILGTENSHARAFAGLIRNCPELKLIGAYGSESSANMRFEHDFGIPCTENPQAFVGKVDGIMITARHGGTHLPLAKPYFKSVSAIFVDKPICCTTSDTEELLRSAKDSNVFLCGGSCLQYAPSLLRLRALADEHRDDIVGASFSAPIEMESPYGGFLFYAPHLVQMCLTVFGNGVKSVYAVHHGDYISALLDYGTFCATLIFGCDAYSASISFRNKTVNGCVKNIPNLYKREFMTFRQGLKNPKSNLSAEFADHVRICSAIEESYKLNGTISL